MIIRHCAVRLRTALALLSFTVLMLGASAGLAARAAAASAQISGTVTDVSTSAPVAGVYVQAYNSGGNPAGSGLTASDGTYTISGLATGSYKVGFIPSGNYVPQFYNGKATLPAADPVSVTAGSTTSGINAALAAGGEITGTVTGASTSSPLANVEIDVYDSGGNFLTYTQTASDGTYTLSGLATGSYKVGFVPSGNFLPQFYNGKATRGCPEFRRTSVAAR